MIYHTSSHVFTEKTARVAVRAHRTLGKGLYAKQSFEAGETILVEEAFIRGHTVHLEFPTTVFEQMRSLYTEQEIKSYTRQKVIETVIREQSEYALGKLRSFTIPNCDCRECAMDDDFYNYCLWMSNAFERTDDCDLSDMFEYASRANHNCIAYNADWDNTGGVMRFTAKRHISVGEEITVNYIPTITTFIQELSVPNVKKGIIRTSTIAERFKFCCQCSDCWSKGGSETMVEIVPQVHWRSRIGSHLRCCM
jgi:hypothetical protein